MSTLFLREQCVMLDADLADLYGVQIKLVRQAVKRHQARFPKDFMFQLSGEEHETLRLSAVSTNTGRSRKRTAPYAFTEQGVAMFSLLLGSPRAIEASIEIVRTFVRERAALPCN